MEASDSFESFIRAGLERLGLEPDPTELAVIAAADAIYGEQIQALMEADLGSVPPELEQDLSRPPEMA